jgi:uncharacterized membrane protein YsdA (DUF1294 family)
MEEFFYNMMKDPGFSWIVIIFLIWNVIVFFLYGTDKLKAKLGAWRISEKTLLLCAFLLGGVGAWAGMETFRHKTLHLSFRILVPIAAFWSLGALYYLYTITG